MEELKVEPADDKLRRFKSSLLRHVARMNGSRVPKIILNCRPYGRRRLGRPLKGLLTRPKQVCQGLTREG